MSEKDTFEKVKAITVDQLSVAPEDVKMDSTFIDDLGFSGHCGTDHGFRRGIQH